MIPPRKTVIELQAYSAPEEGRGDKIRLDFNENTQGFPWLCPDIPAWLLTTYPEYGAFLDYLSEAWQMDRNSLFLTNGSDEALSVIASTFIEPDVDTAVISKPTFPMIAHYLRLAQAKLVEVTTTEDLEFDVATITKTLENGVKLALFASPDNPTGAILTQKQVKNWCETYPKTLFVIDEAYGEFVSESLMGEVKHFENLIVTRTFSKAWGLAGLRLGVLAAHPTLIDYMTRVRSPYSVNSIAVYFAQKLLESKDLVDAQIQATISRKRQVLHTIEQLGYRVKAGHANFFLMYLGVEAQVFCDFCEQRNILVRNRTTLPKMWGMVRVSIGTEEEMGLFLKCVADFKASRALIFDLDDTLVDTSKSYDATVAELVLLFSGKPLVENELKALRARGGFNDDWDAAQALLTERGVTVSRDEIETKGKALYLEKAKVVETLYIDTETLKLLQKRYRLMVVTGRPRDEYTPVWDERLTSWFERIYCQDDFNGARRKPEPDLILAAMNDAGIDGGIYVGNSVDDMHAARQSGLIPIAVTTTHDAALLENAGATLSLESVNAIGKALLL